MVRGTVMLVAIVLSRFTVHGLRFSIASYHPLMKAVVIVAHGGVEGIEIREVPTPENVTADLVRVRVRAAGLNRADILQRMGRYPAPPGVSPDIPGLEFAGLVDKIGPAVRLWSEGQRVFGITAGGAQAEYVIVPESTLAEIPDLLDWTTAAAVPEAFITAHDALFTQANLSAGEILLVHAAGSGVGTAAIQLARAAGAVVFGTGRTPDKLERAKAIGLAESIVMTNDLQQLVRAANGWTKGKGVDVILDLVGGGYLEERGSSQARTIDAAEYISGQSHARSFDDHGQAHNHQRNCLARPFSERKRPPRDSLPNRSCRY